MLCAVCCLLFVSCCLLLDVGDVLFFVYCLMFVVCCLLVVVWRGMFGTRCLWFVVFVVVFVVFVECSLVVGCCSRFGVSWLMVVV